MTQATETLTVGDIVNTTDDSGYETLMLVTYVGPVTTWEDGTMVTFPAYMGPLFNSWHRVNTPHGAVGVPSVQVGPSGWVTRKADQVGATVEWEDNPMNYAF